MRANRATTLLARSLLNRIKEWSEFRIRLTLAFPRASRRRRHPCWEAGNNRDRASGLQPKQGPVPHWAIGKLYRGLPVAVGRQRLSLFPPLGPPLMEIAPQSLTTCVVPRDGSDKGGRSRSSKGPTFGYNAEMD